MLNFNVSLIKKEGFIPAISYGAGFNIPIKLDSVAVKILDSLHFSENTTIDLEISGLKDKNNEFPVFIKNVQYHPLTEAVIHVDFMRISLGKKIRVKIPVVLKGESIGVKNGGILEQMLWEMNIEALPRDIPEKIEVVISNLSIGESIHIKDLDFPEKVRILESQEEVIVTVVAKAKEAVEEISPEEVKAEPEVIKEKEEKEKDKKEKDKKRKEGR